MIDRVWWRQFFGSEDIGGEEDQQPNYVDINPLKDYGTERGFL